jgi:hypothetical protein
VAYGVRRLLRGAHPYEMFWVDITTVELFGVYKRSGDLRGVVRTGDVDVLSI